MPVHGSGVPPGPDGRRRVIEEVARQLGIPADEVEDALSHHGITLGNPADTADVIHRLSRAAWADHAWPD